MRRAWGINIWAVYGEINTLLAHVVASSPLQCEGDGGGSSGWGSSINSHPSCCCVNAGHLIHVRGGLTILCITVKSNNRIDWVLGGTLPKKIESLIVQCIHSKMIFRGNCMTVDKCAVQNVLQGLRSLYFGVSCNVQLWKLDLCDITKGIKIQVSTAWC